MAQAYSIYAYSPSLNQTQREIQLNGDLITEQQQAQRRADGFAQILNRDMKQNVTDWVGKIEWQTYGLASVDQLNKGR